MGISVDNRPFAGWQNAVRERVVTLLPVSVTVRFQGCIWHAMACLAMLRRGDTPADPRVLESAAAATASGRDVEVPSGRVDLSADSATYRLQRIMVAEICHFL